MSATADDVGASRRASDIRDADSIAIPKTSEAFINDTVECFTADKVLVTALVARLGYRLQSKRTIRSAGM
jgi:hypothetical protein